MKRIWLVLLLSAFLLAGCMPPTEDTPSHTSWAYADLRQIDSPDAVDPFADLAAVFLRTEANDFQVRLDFVDLPVNLDYDIHLFIDHHSGGGVSPIPGSPSIEWDVWVTASNGQLVVRGVDGSPLDGLNPRLEYNSTQDTLVLSFDAQALGLDPTGAQLMAAVTTSGTLTPLDWSDRISINAQPPAQAPLLLGFWDSMLAATPSQALRSWDGAHTGPYNNRHGLYNLLKAVEAYAVPVTLFDLKTSESLSALDFVGGQSLVESLTANELLSLPDVMALSTANPYFLEDPSAMQSSHQDSRQAGLDFQLAGSGSGSLFNRAFPLAYLQQGSVSPDLVITLNQNPASSELVTCERWQQSLVISLPQDAQGASLLADRGSGPSVELNRALLKSAQTLTGYSGLTDPCKGAFIFLGGDLQSSALGDPTTAAAVLSYISSHPWIRPLSLASFSTSVTDRDYLVSPPPVLDLPVFDRDGQPLGSGLTVRSLQAELLKKLEQAPDGPLKDSAWKMYTSLLTSTSDQPDIFRLKAGYLGQVGVLLAAADWSAAGSAPCPAGEICTKLIDIDADNQDDILLYSEHILAVLEPYGGTLEALFWKDQSVAHQVIAPGWQFLVGASDPLTWLLDHGVASDPSLSPGAFSTVPAGSLRQTAEPFSVEIIDGTVIFTSPTGDSRKSFTIDAGTLLVEVHTVGNWNVQLTLAPDPWLRFEEDWWKNYGLHSEPTSWIVSAGEELRVNIETIGVLGNPTLRSFADTLPYLGVPEDPFIDYGPGYFFPFPVSQITVPVSGTQSFRISFEQP